MFSTCKNFYAFLFYMEKNFYSRKCWRVLSLRPWSSINSSCKNLLNHGKVELLLFDDSKLSTIDNNLNLKVSVKYIMTTNRFSVPLLWYCFLSLALNIYIFIFFTSGVHPLPTLFSLLHLREQWDMCLCFIFLSLFRLSLCKILLIYFLSCPIVINYIEEKNEIMYFLIFFDKQTKQCLEIGYSAIPVKHGRVLLFF